MKKVIFSILVILFSLCANAQSDMQPKRYALNLYSKNKLEITTDAALIKKYCSYSVSANLVAILVSDESNKDISLFFGTKDEYKFLKEQLKTTSIQIVLDEKEFMGYSKIRFY